MTLWLERTEGYFFPRENLSAAAATKLQMLTIDDAAQVVDGGTLLPFEKSFGLTGEDAELLMLPPRNPYRLSIRTEGFIGGKIFRYIVDFLDGAARPVFSPRINGVLLHVDEETFRLTAEQFALIELVKAGNENLSREEALLNVKRIQNQAEAAGAQLDGYISEDNKKIVVPDKLSVDFTEHGDKVTVQPVLLENRGGELKPIDSADFQGAFANRKNILGIYRGKGGARYVFSQTLRGGLEQIKSVGAMSKADAARYRLQPKELFWGAAFDFSYSDRVIGVEPMTIDSYQISDGVKISWAEEPFHSALPAPKNPVERSPTFVLKIKENFERVDYAKDLTARGGKFFADVLRADVKLLPHQIFGVWKMARLWQIGWRGVLVADDMGLGKTLQTLTFVAGLKKFCGVNLPMLIVAPVTILTNWQDEYKKFLRGNIFGEVVPLHEGGLKKFLTDELTPNGKRKLSLRNLPANALALTTYETLRDYQFSFAEIPWSVIIADEAQKIKNPDAGITKALKAMKYDFAICLSGTPVENSWRDLWSIVDFVQPAHLGDLKAFAGKYLKRLTDDAENIRRLGEDLKNAVNPLLLRRMKEDRLPALPAKKISRCRAEMPPYQAKIYSAVLEKYRRGNFRTPLDFLRELREVSLHPDLLTLSEEKFFALDADEVIGRSARLMKTFALLDEIKARGEKVLIFVTSRKMQAILKHLLEVKFGMEIFPPINGTMNGAARQRIIAAFKERQGFNALILSPEAAGVGFTVTEANNVIHLSRTWNPAKENQATDRVYRIGQKKIVNVYLPLACNENLRGKTFDENLDALLNCKNVLSANVLFPTAETDADVKTLAEMLATPPDEILSSSLWTIEDVDAVSGLAFEKIVCELYDGMENFSASLTPGTNDYGADVVVQSSTDRTGLLIQCKHKENPASSTGKAGIQQICAAVKYYESKYRVRKFRPVVVTNAENFTSGAIKLAQENDVRLIARRELESLLAARKVLKC